MAVAGIFVFAVVGILSGCRPGAEHLEFVADPARRDIVSVTAGADNFADHTDVNYRACKTNCARNQLDVYLPDGPAVGTIVFFHGGGFEGGSKELVIVMGMIKSQTERGWVVVTPNYRLARPTFASSRNRIIADATAALRWTRSKPAVDMGVPTGAPLVVAGHSAGGTIAGLLATTITDGSIDGWVSISGILDWTVGPNSSAVADVLHADGAHGPSPVELLTADTPPGYMVHGDQDDVVEFFNLAAAGSATLEAGAPNLTFDLVDRTANGTSLGYARGHIPVGGANTTRFNSWLDDRLDS